MKFIAKAFVVLVLVVSLTACGSKADAETAKNTINTEQSKELTPPEGFTEDLHNLGCQAYVYMGMYENGLLEADECYIRLKTIYEKAKAIHDDPNQPKEVQLNAIGIAGYCFRFNNKLLSGDTDIKGTIEELGEFIKIESYLE